MICIPYRVHSVPWLFLRNLAIFDLAAARLTIWGPIESGSGRVMNVDDIKYAGYPQPIPSYIATFD
jgi:hypothetical protein